MMIYAFYVEEFSINPKISVVESFIPFFNRLRDELVDVDKVDQSILKDFMKMMLNHLIN